MKRTNESGRSMVEMLGVLAIIGVLSIGGIMGYTTAMNRYRANEAIDMATKYATVAYTSCQTQKTMNPALESCENKYPTFANAGLGAVPSSLTSIETATAHASGEDAGVAIKLKFNDTNVCSAAASALGYGAKPGDDDKDKEAKLAGGWEDCSGDDKSLHLVVKQS